jgi:predicted DNA-binding antitoxin AbrB/MazE fold protein
MSQVEAIYQNGVFKPLKDLGLPENQRVRLSVQLLQGGDVQDWLARVQERHQQFIAERGHLPDSAIDIAEDRRR